MRLLAAVAVIVASVAGTACAQNGAHAGFSGHASSAPRGGVMSHAGPGRLAAPMPRGGMSAPGAGRFAAPMPHGGMSGPGLGRFAAPPRFPVARAPYSGVRAPYSGMRVPYAGNRGPSTPYAPRTGFSRLNPTPGGRHSGPDGRLTQFGGSPGSGHSNWGDRDHNWGDGDHDGDDRHHRMPYWWGYGAGYWPGYGYGISGWYLSPYVLGEPGTLAYGDWSGYGDFGGNQGPYVDSYGAQNPNGYGGPGYGGPGYGGPGYGGAGYGGGQGYGPEPGYQGSSYQEPDYQAPSYQGPQPGRQVYAPSVPVQSASSVPEAAVTLVFNDGRPSEQIHNYLLTSTKLTVLDAKFREIPLDQINMAATEEANRAAGIDFRSPNGTR